jgi:hypothetical protein
MKDVTKEKMGEGGQQNKREGEKYKRRREEVGEGRMGTMKSKKVHKM